MRELSVVSLPLGPMLPVSDGSAPAGPRRCTCRPSRHREDRVDQGPRQVASQAVRRLQLLRRTRLQSAFTAELHLFD